MIMDLIVTVKEIKGHCPAHKVGDTFTIKASYLLVSEIPVCMHALASLIPFYNALRFCEPASMGIEGKKDKTKAYIQCPDSVAYTDGGTVTFEITRAAPNEETSGSCR
jgi:uncharacterized repeat protein (TIGR04076 family)